MPVTYKKVTRVKELKELSPGDHVRITRSMYDHHMVVMEVVDERNLDVVHFNSKEAYDSFLIFPQIFIDINNYVAIFGSLLKFGMLFPAKVRRQKLCVDTQKEEVQVLDYSPEEKVFSSEEIIKRANAKVGANDYNIFWNNCESFINGVVIGKNVSNQGRQAAIAGGLVLLALIVLIVAIVLAFWLDVW